MKTLSHTRFNRMQMKKQRGLVLFVALIALVVMSLAAVALIRSVDTSAMIAGNLAFKQSATSSAGTGTQAAIDWITTIQNSSALNVLNDPTHPLNQTNAANGYYSNVDPALDLFASSTWSTTTSKLVGTDASANSISYIIQRMCRTANTSQQLADCLYSAPKKDKNGQDTPTPQTKCNPASGGYCPLAGQSPQIRITVRTTGPKNTVSYVQAFVL